MKKVLEIALGVVTSIGGFLDAGAIASCAQAGARFRYQLIWAILLWLASFGRIEKAVSFLGLVTLAFVIAAFRLHPGRADVLSGMLPHLPTHDAGNYWFLSVSMIGAIITPFMFFFYSSGAIEEKWNRSYLGVNRAVAVLGMVFGAVIAIAVIVVSGAVLAPSGVRVET